MPTLVTHPSVPLVVASLAGLKKVPGRLLFAGCIVSILPDIDVIGLKLGVPYGHVMGHRGFSHSIVFAGLIGLMGIIFSKKLNANRSIAFLVLFLSTVSHGVLDASTSGGLGIGFFSPFSNERFFFPWRPIKVSPLSLDVFWAHKGSRVLQSEILWVWLPALSFIIIGVILRKGSRWLQFITTDVASEYEFKEGRPRG